MTVVESLHIVPGAGAHGQPLRWRPFGLAGDLELDFRSGDRPALVTRLLAGCLPELPAETAEETAWHLTLAGRIGGLAAIVAHTLDVTTLTVRLDCPRCAQPFEIELRLPELVRHAQAAEQEPVVAANLGADRHLALRRPTGADQRRWRSMAFASRAEAEAGILASLRVPALDPLEPDDAALAQAAEVMEEQDPLTAFAVNCACPACGGEDDHPLDLEALLLERLDARQRAMTLEIHRLASRYGWSEAEVLAVPPPRRAEYLRLLDREMEQP